MKKRSVALIGALVLILFCSLVVLIIAGAGAIYFFQRRAETNIMPTNEAWLDGGSSVGMPTLEPSPPNPVPQTPTVSTVPAAPPQPVPNVDFNGIRFYLDPRLAQGVLPELVSAAPGDPAQSMAGEVHPEYTQFTFQGYVLSNTFHDPRLYVYPLGEYRAMDGAVDEIANRLSELLVKQPEQVEELPFLPLWNAGQVFHAQVQYLDFKNGSGVRFLTQYAQSFVVVNNTELFYTFQGITADGNWYIAAVLPVSHPSLPESWESSQVEPTDAERYYQQIGEQLTAESGESFTPSLSLLDELIRSLSVK
ncbi:MAG: hypothetical protein ACOY16_00995 [Chloroflexota bacterium]